MVEYHTKGKHEYKCIFMFTIYIIYIYIMYIKYVYILKWLDEGQ